MCFTRASRIPFACAAALLVLLALAAVTTTRRTAVPRGIELAAVDAAPPSPAPEDGIVRLFESTLAFVRDISRAFSQRQWLGAVVRLLVIVEVLIGALGVVSCITIWGRGKATLVYRIIDVMGALFLAIALLLFGMTMLRPA